MGEYVNPLWKNFAPQHRVENLLLVEQNKVNYRDIRGNPYITVSPKGIANGLSDIPNDGADFGPDTPNTQTMGIQEAVNYSLMNGIGKVVLKGNYGDKFILNTNVLAYITEVTNPTPPQPLEIVGEGYPYIQASTSFVNTPINGSSSYPKTMFVILNLPTRVRISGLTIDGNNTVQWCIAGTATEIIIEDNKAINTTDTGINITSMDYSGQGTQIANKVIIRNNFCDGNYGSDINTEGMNEIIEGNQCFSGNGSNTQANIIAENAVSVIIANNIAQNAVDWGIVVESGVSNTAENGKVVVADNICMYSGGGIFINTESSSETLTDIIVHDNIIRKTGSNGAIIVTGSGTDENISIHNNTIGDTGSTDTSGEIMIGGGVTAKYLYIADNIIYNNTTVNTTRPPILISSGTISDVFVDGNIVYGNEGNSSFDSSTSGTTAGTVTIKVDKFTNNYKKYIITFSGYENDTTTDQTIDFPQAFTSYAGVSLNTTGLTISVTTTGITITAPDSTTTYSGIVIVEGY